MAERFTEGFAKSLRDKGITNADVYLSQNDGTLMTMEHARRYPILTVACGPTNSIRGASYLSSLKDAIVVDVGGTTTDLGVIQNSRACRSISCTIFLSLKAGGYLIVESGPL